MAKQCDLILMHMKKYGSITHMEAEMEYGIARLASRINDEELWHGKCFDCGFEGQGAAVRHDAQMLWNKVVRA